MSILTKDFYQREDTVQMAKDLPGKYLVTNFGGQKTTGRIIKTEAYKVFKPQLSAGPGVMSKAMGIKCYFFTRRCFYLAQNRAENLFL